MIPYAMHYQLQYRIAFVTRGLHNVVRGLRAALSCHIARKMAVKPKNILPLAPGSCLAVCGNWTNDLRTVDKVA
jgi:hypothetical protein